MKAAVFTEPGRIGVATDLPMPEPGTNEVLVRVVACGICGSDMHMYRTGAHRAELVRASGDGREIPGHEFSGVVAALGSGVTEYAVGDRVVGVTMGGMAEYVLVPVNPYQIVKVPDGVSFREAATTEPLADALEIVSKAGLAAKENVVVIGVGIIGLGVIQVLKTLHLPLGHVIAVDVSDARLAEARALGAGHTVNPRDRNVVEEVRRICGYTPVHYPATNPPNVDVVIDCAGYIKHMPGPPPLQTAMELLKPVGGRVVCFGAFEDHFLIDMMPLIFKQICIIGSLGYQPAMLAGALELMAQREVDRERLISDAFPLEQVGEAFERQGDGRAIKVLIEPEWAR